MKKVQQGFTLIELMIVVAIIGILAAVAIPSYQDYTKRAHVSEGLSLAAAAKTGVSEYYGSMGAWPTAATGGTINERAGIAKKESINGNAVDSVEIKAGGLIEITYNDKVKSGAKVVLKPVPDSGAIKWECNKAVGTTVETKLLPSNCR